MVKYHVTEYNHELMSRKSQLIQDEILEKLVTLIQGLIAVMSS